MSLVFRHIKRFIKAVLPQHFVAYIKRIRGEKLQQLDFSVLPVIAKCDVKELSEPLFLETQVLSSLGFNNEKLQEFPQELYSFCGKGLRHWQYPNQFGEYLALLSKLKPESYLEIGVRHGGTFIITLEYLKKYVRVKNAVAIDIAWPPSLVRYKKINPVARFYQLNSQTEDFRKFLEKEKHFDLILIDGNHDEAACMNDFNIVKDIGNIIVLHDIVSDVCPGVVNTWTFIKKEYAADFLFFEFTKQYKSVREKTGQSFFGIGLAVKKEFARQMGIK